MAYLYLELLKDSLNEYAYAAELAGLNYDLQNTVYGMYVSIQSLSPSPFHRIKDLTPSTLNYRPTGLLRLSQPWVDGWYEAISRWDFWHLFCHAV